MKTSLLFKEASYPVQLLSGSGDGSDIKLVYAVISRSRIFNSVCSLYINVWNDIQAMVGTFVLVLTYSVYTANRDDAPTLITTSSVKNFW